MNHQVCDFEIKKLQERIATLEEALIIAANQLEGVSIAFAKNSRNIEPRFFIHEYKELAERARKALEGK